jgi:hypothetical protein
MQIDTLKSSTLNLLALVNTANGLSLTEEHVTVGVPVARTPDANPRNTSVTLTAVPGKGYSGTMTVTYTRLGMDSGVVLPSFLFDTTEFSTPANLLTSVASTLGLIETSLILTGGLPIEEGTTSTVTLAGNETSLVYAGSQELSLNFPSTRFVGTVEVATL